MSRTYKRIRQKVAMKIRARPWQAFWLAFYVGCGVGVLFGHFVLPSILA